MREAEGVAEEDSKLQQLAGGRQRCQDLALREKQREEWRIDHQTH